MRDVEQLSTLTGRIQCEHPNKLINSFSGIIELNYYNSSSNNTTSTTTEPIQPNNILLRGCILRNTDWIIGLVINTGHDTKIMMGNTITQSKRSNLEAKTSKEIGKIIFFLILLCFFGSLAQSLWNSTNKIEKIWYLQWDKSINPVSFWFIDFFYFFLLHATFIPVSLYVSMSVIRYFQAYFMENDLDMYYNVTDTSALVRTLTLNEELGQISHIFSDKTGTLTCNIMEYRKSSINGISYGVGITEIGKAAWKLLGSIFNKDVLDIFIYSS